MLLEDLQVILKVAEFRSITAAAESLDMRMATASAAIKRVEKSLGAELFIRTTRQLRLSPAGERYLPHCQQALQTLEQAKQHLKADLDTIEGELRIAAPSDLGRNLILPWLDNFMEHHQGLSIKLHVSDSNIDFFRDPVDIAIRYGKPNDANLYGFKICDVPRVICASPEYIQKHGSPTNLDQLSQHNGLLYQLHDILHDVWEFTQHEKPVKVRMQSNRASNDAELVRRWCVAGKGLAAKSCLDMSDDLLNSRVKTVLPDYPPKSTELWLICPSRQSITPAVRLLRDMLQQQCLEILSKLKQQKVIA